MSTLRRLAPASRRAAAPIVAVVAALALAACSTATPPAMVVNGTELSRQELQDQLRAVAVNPDFVAQITRQTGRDGLPLEVAVGPSSFDAEYVAETLRTNVFQVVISDGLASFGYDEVPDDMVEAQRSALEADPAVAALLEQFPPWYADLRVRWLAEDTALRNLLADQPIDATLEAATLAYYEANPDEFVQSCSRHILVPTEGEANEIIDLIASGASFADLTIARSIDSGSGATGGDLGCVARGVFVPEFEDMVFTAPVGEVSGPVQTQFGFHVVEVLERGPGELTQEVIQTATNAVNTQRGELLRAYFDEKLAAIDLEIDPRFGGWQLVDRPPFEPGGETCFHCTLLIGAPATPGAPVEASPAVSADDGGSTPFLVD